MTKKRVRILLLSCAALVLCIGLIIGSTLALFTDDKKVTNHLESGSLDVTLTRTGYSSRYLNQDGLLETRGPKTGLKDDFSKANAENVFALEDGALLAPLSMLTVDLVVSNNSKVAFTYWIEIKVGDGEFGKELASQLEVTVTVGETVEKQYLSEGLEVGKGIGFGVVKVGGESAFTVTVEFKDLANETNNAAMIQSVPLDLVVHAVQAV